MRWTLGLLLLAMSPPAMAAPIPVPLNDSIGLNIGLNCQWQTKCMRAQQRAMKRSLDYVYKRRPPTWRIHVCNRNASRGRERIDWVGFDNCVRNVTLPYSPPRPPRRRSRV